MAKSELYVNKHNLEKLSALAAKKGVTPSAFLGELLNKIIDDGDTRPILLQIPTELLKKDKAGLRLWLSRRLDGVLTLFYPE